MSKKLRVLAGGLVAIALLFVGLLLNLPPAYSLAYKIIGG